MYKCVKLEPKINIIKDRAVKFLEEFNLRYETLDTLYAIINEKGDWLAIGGQNDNVLKCFAIKDNYKGEGLFDSIISSLITDSFNEGIDELFVYTKPRYLEIFKSFNFDPLAQTENSCLLLRNEGGVESILKSLDYQADDSNIGSIVMNANPFTKGHLYLIQRARQKVDRVLVFIVEKENDQFPFSDRFQLVKEAVRDIKDVIVLPSTNLIVSNATFPSYFLKENELVDIEHAKIDAEIFKRYFVPRFNIKIRFLGTEPYDKSTAIYNKVLKDTLNPDCSVEIIKRLRKDEDFISASKVRDLILKGKIEEIREMVPENVYEYILRKS
ncbi:MAG: adenylyltransferase/cytidyltransferase family protein [Tissierellia bacterium]|nr:adenylyltransferase/cytidyltransferase family protein [Tissierellia bacterium]